MLLEVLLAFWEQLLCRHSGFRINFNLEGNEGRNKSLLLSKKHDIAASATIELEGILNGNRCDILTT